jgi:hypothetical protein
MFRASSCPSSGAQQLQQQPLVYRTNVVVAVLLVVVGPVRTDYGQQHCYHHFPTVNQPEAAAAAAVDRLLIMGIRISETW